MRNYFRKLEKNSKSWLTWLFVLPYLIRYRLRPSKRTFAKISEALSLIPFSMGMSMREEFYRRTLRSCGDNVRFGFGTILNYSDISIGNHVSFGRYNSIGLVDFGDHVLVASRCSFLSGRHTHNFAEIDRPIHMQESNRVHITVGRDVWVGVGSIVMSSIGDGAVIGAGSVVTKPVEGYTVVAGNPARPLRKRGE